MGRRRKIVKADITDLHQRLPPCRVCEGPAGGFHYGVNTCEACKGFFHRNSKNYEYFKCNHGGRCKVIYSNHKVCKKCRYDKCLAVGMAKQAIKTGRYSLEKRTQDTLEIKSLKTKVHNSPHNDVSSTNDQPVDTIVKSESSPLHNSPPHQHQLQSHQHHHHHHHHQHSSYHYHHHNQRQQHYQEQQLPLHHQGPDTSRSLAVDFPHSLSPPRPFDADGRERPYNVHSRRYNIDHDHQFHSSSYYPVDHYQHHHQQQQHDHHHHHHNFDQTSHHSVDTKPILGSIDLARSDGSNFASDPFSSSTSISAPIQPPTFPRDTFYTAPPFSTSLPPPSSLPSSLSSSTGIAASSSSSSTHAKDSLFNTPPSSLSSSSGASVAQGEALSPPDIDYWSDISSPQSMPPASSASAVSSTAASSTTTSSKPCCSLPTTTSAASSEPSATSTFAFTSSPFCSYVQSGKLEKYKDDTQSMCGHCTESKSEIYEIYSDPEKIVSHLLRAHDEYIKPILCTSSDEEFKKKCQEHVVTCEMNHEMFGLRERLPDTEYDEIYARTGLDADGRQGRQDVLLHIMEMRIRMLAKFSKRIPGFSLLPMEDQVHLVKHSRYDIMYACGFNRVDPETGVMFCGDGNYRCWREFMLEMKVDDVVQRNVDLRRRLGNLNLTHEERVIFACILLMAPDRKQRIKSCSSATWLIYLELNSCLIYLLSKRLEKPLQRFAKVVDLMVTLRSYDNYMMGIFKGLRFDKYTRGPGDPLLRDLLDFGGVDDSDDEAD